MTNQDKDQIKEIKRMYEHQGDFQTAEVLFKRKNIKIAAEEMGVEYIETDPRHQTSLSFYDWQEYEKKGEYIINEVFKDPKLEPFDEHYKLSQLKDGDANLNKRRNKTKTYQNGSQIDKDFIALIELVNELIGVNKKLLMIYQDDQIEESITQDCSDLYDEWAKLKNKAVRLYSKVHTLMFPLHTFVHNLIVSNYKYHDIKPDSGIMNSYHILIVAYTALIDTASFIAEFNRVSIMTSEVASDFFGIIDDKSNTQYEKRQKEYEKFNRIANRYNI